MTVRERVIASRLIQKIEGQGGYAKQIGLSGRLDTVGSHAVATKPISKKHKI